MQLFNFQVLSYNSYLQNEVNSAELPASFHRISFVNKSESSNDRTACG